MKKKLVVLLFVIGGTFYGQEKVGIGTNQPEYTLDVDGTVALENPGADKDNVLLSVEPDTKQLIEADISNRPFNYISYAINLSKDGQDYAANVNLGVSSKKYVMVLVQSFLIKTPKNGDIYPSDFYKIQDKSRYAAYLNGGVVKSVNKFSNQKYLPIKFDNGWIVNEIGGTLKQEYDGSYLSIPLKDSSLSTKGGFYTILLDYADSRCFDERSKYTWIATFLVMDKNWIK